MINDDPEFVKSIKIPEKHKLTDVLLLGLYTKEQLGIFGTQKKILKKLFGKIDEWMEVFLEKCHEANDMAEAKKRADRLI